MLHHCMYIYQFEKKSTSSRLKINNFQIYALPSDKDVLLFTKTSRGENLLVDNNGLLCYSKKPNNYVPVQERKTSLWPPRPELYGAYTLTKPHECSRQVWWRWGWVGWWRTPGSTWSAAAPFTSTRKRYEGKKTVFLRISTKFPLGNFQNTMRKISFNCVKIQANQFFAHLQS